MDPLSNLNATLSRYSNKSKNVCMYTTVAIILALVFIISPAKQYSFSFLGKYAAIILIIYTLYEIFHNTQFLYTASNVSFSTGSWDIVKTNIISSYIFSFFLLILLFSIIHL